MSVTRLRALNLAGHQLRLCATVCGAEGFAVKRANVSLAMHEAGNKLEDEGVQQLEPALKTLRVLETLTLAGVCAAVTAELW